MKTIDCFTFFNELDLLEFRLKLLDAHVDHFVIAESNLTHSGKPKPFYFEENKKRFEPWLHKITSLQLNQSVQGLDLSKEEKSYNPESAAWKLENEHRNALSVAGSIAGDEDLVVISDLDEIPDPFVLKKLHVGKDPVVLSMLFHYYFFNCQNAGAERWWNGSIVCTGKQFRQTTAQKLRDNRNVYKRITKGGWHFSYLGGLEKIKYKIQSFAHTEFNKKEFLDDANIIKAMEEGKDIFNRPDARYKFVSPYYYPSWLRNLMRQYPAFLHLRYKDSFFNHIGYSIKNLFDRS
jgi:beta-1,4-mannosyl-glycoprotein beta-1,4-N-acetylglucosaminyltransferase